MSTEPPEGPPPDQPPPGSPYGGGPYGPPPPGGEEGGPWGGGPSGGGQGPYGKGPYGKGPNGPYGGAPDPLAGMPPLAEGGKRVLARIIDLVIVLIPAVLLDWAVGGLRGNDFSTGRSAVGGLFTAGIGFFYEWTMTRDRGQSIGKRRMGLRTAMLADGDIPTSQAAATRALVLWLPAFCCSFFWFVIIGITVLLDRPYKQGLHDKAARTVVVRAD
ncbi:RDD family protein [Actinacidiphila acididurans]|uniref:RDD family protein n=1 Tax=Actinacidiphila acididurans TaxID=2784346 RepID=A0ABS2TZP7_9ACTN|nr:RDD family protein [Actinacidiphila acididurans]MBM9508815.1 RDD family protein [Actinacidiphila acididurans]